MITPYGFCKIFEGAANRTRMFSLFDRHAQCPDAAARRSGRLHEGEWFEIGQAEHDYMREILPPLWMNGEMFGLREYLAGAITSVFFALPIDGCVRYFHGYCNLSVRDSAARMRAAILARESMPVKAMSRTEQLEHIWSTTHADYRGYAEWEWPAASRGRRTVLVYGGARGTTAKLLADLSGGEIAAKLPMQFRTLSEPVAA